MFVTGACAGIIDIGTTWMSDLKEGVCREAFWLPREQCCWSANDSSFDSENCSQVKAGRRLLILGSVVDMHVCV